MPKNPKDLANKVVNYFILNFMTYTTISNIGSVNSVDPSEHMKNSFNQVADHVKELPEDDLYKMYKGN
jgi:hypothetical protein